MEATINLTGTIPAKATYVLAYLGAISVILEKENQTSTARFYNGDDAIVLRKDIVALDRIGKVNTVDQLGIPSSAGNGERN